MADNYFVVLELPETKELKFTEGSAHHNNFWDRAANAIGKGKAKIISRRKDTGVAEEVREHVNAKPNFSTFILVNMPLKRTSEESIIFRRAAKRIMNLKCATVVDTTEKYQLLSVEG